MKKKPSKKLPVGKWLGYAALVILAIISIGPIWIAFKTALSGPTAWLTSAGSLVPHETTLFNFQRVLGFVDASDPRITQTGMAKINFFRALLNSVIFTALAVVPQIFFSATAAYAFARLKFPGRDMLFFMFIAATMIPGAVLFIPNFILIKDLGWLNTFQGMAAPYALMTPFAVFYLRQMFLATPKDVEEAARIDGASYFSIFFKMIMPMHSGVAGHAGHSGDGGHLERVLLALPHRARRKRSRDRGRHQCFRTQQQSGSPDWTGLMACTVLGMIPMIALMVFFGRKVVESFQFSGGK